MDHLRFLWLPHFERTYSNRRMPTTDIVCRKDQALWPCGSDVNDYLPSFISGFCGFHPTPPAPHRSMYRDGGTTLSRTAPCRYVVPGSHFETNKHYLLHKLPNPTSLRAAHFPSHPTSTNRSQVLQRPATARLSAILLLDSRCGGACTRSGAAGYECGVVSSLRTYPTYLVPPAREVPTPPHMGRYVGLMR